MTNKITTPRLDPTNLTDKNAFNASARVNNLLDKPTPSYRQAYSDRTAWLMACLSELAYIRFNPLFSNNTHKQWFLDHISKLVDDHRKKSLDDLINLVGYDHLAEKKKLESELEDLRFQLAATFDCGGTQAILVSNNKFLVLAFRGTEATSVKDIKADAKAKKTPCETGGGIHAGFKEAFERVEKEIQRTIREDQFNGKPLFITGHSLGGALATIAAKRLSHNGGIAACYTFGAPRVGDENWVAELKAPIYRLVNAADCVTMLPPGDMTLTTIAWLFRTISKIPIPLLSSLESVSRWLLSNFAGYLHGGNMRYLTNCPSGSYATVKLLYSVSLLHRLKGLVLKGLPWKRFLSDHSIGVYRKKLMIVAENRNP